MSEPPVVLVHGFGTSYNETWVANGWRDLLIEAKRDVLGIDLLGHGESEKPTDPESYKNLESLVLSQFPQVEVDGIGFSLGAQVLLWLAAQNPNRFRRLVVAGIGQNIFEGKSDIEPWNKKIIDAVSTGKADTPEFRYFAQLGDSPGANREALVACLQRPDPKTFTLELIEKVSIPVLVVLGEEDFAGPADPLITALPDSTLIVLPGVDHFSTPKNFGFIDAALKFLDADPFSQN
tara:strand:- start:506 stop:1210 length:705 start_codon:yes stop_codon:yes gene_type:complete